MYNYSSSLVSVLLLLVCVIVTQTSVVVHGCSCLPPITVNTSLASSKYAVRATILEALPNTSNEPIPFYKYYMMRVIKMFKGGSGVGKILVKTASQESLCGVTLNVTTTYLLFAADIVTERVPGYIGKLPVYGGVALCDANKRWSDVTSAEQKLLNSYKSP